jgi:hypothetical protein
MGNCLKRQSIFSDSYLFEPLSPNTEEIFMQESQTSNQVATELKETIVELESKIISLTNKIELLEKNTQENLRLLSDDIHYINNKTITSINTTLKRSRDSNTSIKSDDSTF